MQLTGATSLSSCLMRRVVFFLFLGVAVMASGLWLGRKECTRCDPFLSKPLLITGFFIFFISVLGSGGAFDSTNNKLVVFSQYVAMLLLFLLLSAFTIFAFVVSINGRRFHEDVEAIRSGNASAVSRGGNRQFHGKSTWLQKRVTDEETWQAIKRCLPKTPVCDKLGKKYPSINSTNSTGWVALPRLQAGCCRPPQDCNFDVVNITYYVLSSNEDDDDDEEEEEGVSAAALRARGSNNSDCSVYGNNATERCYACNSCKAAFLESARGTWRTAAIINMCVIGLALASSAYSLGKFIVRPSDVGLDAGPSSESLPSWRKKSGLEPRSSVAGRPSSPSALSGPATASGPAVTQGLEAERTAIGAAECRSRGRDLGRSPREPGDRLQMENDQNQQSSERSEIQAE